MEDLAVISPSSVLGAGSLSLFCGPALAWGIGLLHISRTSCLRSRRAQILLVYSLFESLVRMKYMRVSCSPQTVSSIFASLPLPRSLHQLEDCRAPFQVWHLASHSFIFAIANILRY
jgi:hypothetical protein